MSILSTDSTVLLHKCDVELLTETNLVNTGYRGKAVRPAITAVLLYQSAVDKWTDCSLVSTGQKGNSGSACSYCSTVTSQCYGNID